VNWYSEKIEKRIIDCDENSLVICFRHKQISMDGSNRWIHRER
jgi:hypothetical protein